MFNMESISYIFQNCNSPGGKFPGLPRAVSFKLTARVIYGKITGNIFGIFIWKEGSLWQSPSIPGRKRPRSALPGDTPAPLSDAMGREFEKKYRASAGALEAVRERYGPFTAITMATTYYDTPSRELSRRKWTLRRRQENDRFVCTLKTPLPDGSRGEWETFCDSIEDAASDLIAAGAPEALEALVSGGLEPVCGVRFLRLARQIHWQDASLELALDSGELLGGGRAAPFREIEVELKAGSDQAAADFGAALCRTFHLAEEPESKFQRALKLARQEQKERTDHHV